MSRTFEEQIDHFVYLANEHSVKIEITGIDKDKGLFEFKATASELSDNEAIIKSGELAKSLGLFIDDKKPNRVKFVEIKAATVHVDNVERDEEAE